MKIKKEDYVNLLSDRLKITKKEAYRIIEAMGEVNVDCVLNGFDVPLEGIGTIQVKYVKPRGEKECRNVRSRETFMSAPVDEHNKLHVKIGSVIKRQLKESTLGNPYNKPE